MHMPVRDWFEQRSFHHQEFSGLAGPGETTRRPAVTLILPAREVAGTIGPILDTVSRLNERTGLVDQVLVIDADSADGTADIAVAHGAEVYSENELLPEYGPAQGKGDAMWRALSVARGRVEIAILIDVLRGAGLPAMAQVDLGSRQNRHQALWDLTRMSSAVLRALARRVPALEQGVPGPRTPGLWDLPGPVAPETYLHAVATQDGLRLDEHLSELLERPPMAQVLRAREEIPAYQANM